MFRQRGREGERGREKHQCVVAPCVLPTGVPGLQPRHVTLTGNRTNDLSVLRPVLNPLSHTSQG